MATILGDSVSEKLQVVVRSWFSAKIRERDLLNVVYEYNI